MPFAADLNALPDFLRQDNQAKIRVFRTGESLELSLSNPKTQATPASWTWQRLGLRVRTLTTAQKDALAIGSGVLITGVQGSAQANGLQTGDVIVSINQTPLNSTTQLNQMAQGLGSGDSVALYVIRGETRQFITLSVDE